MFWEILAWLGGGILLCVVVVAVAILKKGGIEDDKRPGEIARWRGRNG